jgi:hypothetical protein
MKNTYTVVYFEIYLNLIFNVFLEGGCATDRLIRQSNVLIFFQSIKKVFENKQNKFVCIIIAVCDYLRQICDILQN